MGAPKMNAVVYVAMTSVVLGAAPAAAQERTAYADIRPRPQQSYGQTVDRIMKYILENVEKNQYWQKNNTIRDGSGNLRPPYFFYAREGLEVSFPAFHHAYFIISFLQYWVYSGDERALRRAEDLAEWNIANSTPKDAQYPHLPYSTATKGRPGGSWDRDTVMSDKPGYMGLAYLQLFRATGKKAYLEAAERIGETLAKLQTPEGNWPFRFNPNTGKVVEPYTSNAVPCLMLLDQLDELASRVRYAEPRKKALRWMLDNPVKTMNWTGFYEDVAPGRHSVGNWSTLDTARYLVARRADDASFLASAIALKNWVEKTFVKKIRVGGETAEGVGEQSVYMYVMAGHTGHLAQLLVDLYRATADETYRTRTLQMVNGMTYYLGGDGRIGMALDNRTFWFSCHISVVPQFLEIMGEFPETAPVAESHLLKTSAAVTAIKYEPRSVRYATDAEGTAVLKLATKLVRVTANGKELPSGDGVKSGWHFNADSGVLRLRHDKGEVRVDLEASAPAAAK